MRSTKIAVSWLVPLFLCGSAGYLAAPARADITPRETGQAYEQALTQLGKGDVAGAIIQLKNILNVTPHNLAARLSLAQAHLQNKDGASAEKELLSARQDGGDPEIIALMLGQAYILQQKYQQTLSELPSGGHNVEVQAQIDLLRGKAYYGLKDNDRAEQLLTLALNAMPGNPEPAQALAQLALNRNDFAGARRFIDRALATPRPAAEAFALRGDIDRGEHRLPDAVQSFSLAIEADPKMLTGWLGRALVRVELGQDKGAMEDLDKTLELSPHNPVALVLKATVYGRTNRKAESTQALRDAVDALKRVPEAVMAKDSQLNLMAGIANFSLGNYPSAEANLNRYVTLQPNDITGRRLLGAALIANNNFSRAVEMMRDAANDSNKDPDFWSILGAAYAKLNDPVNSEAAYRRALELDPNSIANRNRLGAALVGKGANDEAISVLTDARMKDPDALQSAVLMVMANLNKGNNKAAADLARGLADKAPKNTFIVHLAGAAAMAGGDDQAARRYFNQALAIDPGYLQAHLNLARLDAKAGDFPAATRRYQDVLRLNPNNVTALVELGSMAETQKKPDQAIIWYEKARSSHPEISSVWYLSAHGYYAMGKYDEALTIAQQYANEHPDEYNMQAVIATIQMAAKKPQDAIATMNRAIETAPDRALAFLTLGNLQYQSGDRVGARLSLRKSLSYKNNAEALTMLVRMEVEAREYKEALRLIDELRKLQPNSLVPDLAAGDVMLQSGQPQAALPFYLAADKRQKSTETVFGIYRARVALGQKDEALALLRGWAAANPQDKAVADLYGNALMEQQRWKDAAPYYRNLLKTDSRNAGYLNNLAWALFSLNDKQARGYAEQALAAEPGNPSVMDTAAWIFIKDNDVERGLQLLRQAAAKKATDPQIQYHLGFALDRLGRRDEALEALRKANGAGLPFEGMADAKQLYDTLMAK